MTAEFRYGLIGKGPWGLRIGKILSSLSRKVRWIDLSRRASGESRDAYQEKVEAILKRSVKDLDIIWLAIPPGDQDVLVRSALDARKHVVVEKPWMCGDRETMELMNLSRRLGLKVGVHYQYCFLDKLDTLKKSIKPSDREMIFSGRFTISKASRLEVPHLHNLGGHLMALKCLFFPRARMGHLKTGYNEPDQRSISIVSNGQTFIVDFTDNHEPIIQRFILAFENNLKSGEPWKLNLRFALEITECLKELESLNASV